MAHGVLPDTERIRPFQLLSGPFRSPAFQPRLDSSRRRTTNLNRPPLPLRTDPWTRALSPPRRVAQILLESPFKPFRTSGYPIQCTGNPDD
jgi:hypothetical protein